MNQKLSKTKMSKHNANSEKQFPSLDQKELPLRRPIVILRL